MLSETCEDYLLRQLFKLKIKVPGMKEQDKQHTKCYPEISKAVFPHKLGFFLRVLWKAAKWKKPILPAEKSDPSPLTSFEEAK